MIDNGGHKKMIVVIGRGWSGDDRGYRMTWDHTNWYDLVCAVWNLLQSMFCHHPVQITSTVSCSCSLFSLPITSHHISPHHISSHLRTSSLYPPLSTSPITSHHPSSLLIILSHNTLGGLCAVLRCLCTGALRRRPRLLWKRKTQIRSSWLHLPEVLSLHLTDSSPSFIV